MNLTGISYLDFTWNPIAMRCQPCAPECDNCWHLKMCDRMVANPLVSELQRKAYAGGEFVLCNNRLDAPLRRKKPAVIGVQFMGDLFHEGVAAGLVYHVFDIMDQCRQHTFLILTKRPQNIATKLYSPSGPKGPRYFRSDDHLPNVGLGTTCGHPDSLWRVGELLKVPAAFRFLSCEPLLGRIVFPSLGFTGPQTVVDWVIIGCESGPHRRPCKLEWVKSLIGQADIAGVPVFVKQLDIDGRVTANMAEWPEWARRREGP